METTDESAPDTAPMVLTVPPRTETVLQAIMFLMTVPEEKVRVILRDGPDVHKLCLDGIVLSLHMRMPECERALLRVGRHLWMVSWGFHTFCEQLTQPGT